MPTCTGMGSPSKLTYKRQEPAVGAVSSLKEESGQNEAWGIPYFFAPEDPVVDARSPEPDIPSFFSAAFSSCNSVVSTAAFFLRSTRFADAFRSPMSDVVHKREAVTKRRKSSRSGRCGPEPVHREGEIVSVPAAEQDSFDDNISALSSLTLENMVHSPPGRRPSQAQTIEGYGPASPPMNGDVLLPHSSSKSTHRRSTAENAKGRTIEHRTTSSPKRSSRTTVLEQMTFRTMEKSEQTYAPNRDSTSATIEPKRTIESHPPTISTSGSSSGGKPVGSPYRIRSRKLRKLGCLRKWNKRATGT